MKNFLINIIKFLGNTVARYRGVEIVEAAMRQLDAFYRGANNVNFNIDTNGEMRILSILSEFEIKNIFDVGANVGQYSLILRKFFPNSKIHAFEIVPHTYKKLCVNIEKYPFITPVNHGLGDKEESIKIHTGNGSETATAFKIDGLEFHNSYYNGIEVLPVRRADNYIIENQIDRVDYLKIDVEGMDLRVIKGFEDEIRKVKVVQFEYGIFNIASEDLLKDFTKYFKEREFVVGKIYPRFVDFFEYHFHHENFHGCNFIAVKSSESELIEKLGRLSAKR